MLASIPDRLGSAVKIAFPNAEEVAYVCTDASEQLYASIGTQKNEEHLEEPTKQRQHEPLAILRGNFNGTERNWTTYESMAHAVFQIFNTLDYLFCGRARPTCSQIVGIFCMCLHRYH